VGGAAPPGPSPAAGLIGTDDRTGQPYLKLPLPKPEALQALLGLVSALAGAR
jgi:hypothetical protein